jgi:uncharacterized protein (TIGR02118 family)
MFRVSVMYPNQEKGRFDIEYYRTKHRELAEKLLTPFGLMKMEVDWGISGGGGQAPPFICVGQLYFDTADGYDRGVAAVGSTLRGDIPNFTNVTPTRQIS